MKRLNSNNSLAFAARVSFSSVELVPDHGDPIQPSASSIHGARISQSRLGPLPVALEKSEQTVIEVASFSACLTSAILVL